MCICERTPNPLNHLLGILVLFQVGKKKIAIKTRKKEKMYDYRRIKSGSPIIDSSSSSSDFLSSSQTKHKINPTHEPPPETDHGDASTEKRSAFGAVLSFHRNRPISSSPSMRVSAVKRAFSMGRSSSISERYCKIHDQHVAPLVSPQAPDDEEFERGRDSRDFGSFNKETKSANGRNKILKSCKRIFGL